VFLVRFFAASPPLTQPTTAIKASQFGDTIKCDYPMNLTTRLLLTDSDSDSLEMILMTTRELPKPAGFAVRNTVLFPGMVIPVTVGR
jgi:hypothetical protein